MLSDRNWRKSAKLPCSLAQIITEIISDFTTEMFNFHKNVHYKNEQRRSECDKFSLSMYFVSIYFSPAGPNVCFRLVNCERQLKYF